MSKEKGSANIMDILNEDELKDAAERISLLRSRPAIIGARLYGFTIESREEIEGAEKNANE